MRFYNLIKTTGQWFSSKECSEHALKRNELTAIITIQLLCAIVFISFSGLLYIADGKLNIKINEISNFFSIIVHII